MSQRFFFPLVLPTERTLGAGGFFFFLVGVFFAVALAGARAEREGAGRAAGRRVGPVRTRVGAVREEASSSSSPSTCVDTDALRRVSPGAVSILKSPMSMDDRFKSYLRKLSTHISPPPPPKAAP